MAQSATVISKFNVSMELNPKILSAFLGTLSETLLQGLEDKVEKAKEANAEAQADGESNSEGDHEHAHAHHHSSHHHDIPYQILEDLVGSQKALKGLISGFKSALEAYNEYDTIKYELSCSAEGIKHSVS